MTSVRYALDPVVSQTNAQLVNRAYEAWNRGDWDAVFGLFDPDIEILPPRLWPEAAPVRGERSVRQAFEAAIETIETQPLIDVLELLENGDQVLTFVRTRGKGKGSGIYMEVEFQQVFTVRQERISRIDFYLDRADARAAAGLATS